MAKSRGTYITVGLTGASGAIYAQSVLRLLDADPRVERVFLVVTEAGLRLIATELDIVAADGKKLTPLLTGTPAKKIEYLPNKDIGASIASGSAPVDGMVIIPCSAGALASIATGIASDLLSRSADVYPIRLSRPRPARPPPGKTIPLARQAVVAPGFSPASCISAV